MEPYHCYTVIFDQCSILYKGIIQCWISLPLSILIGESTAPESEIEEPPGYLDGPGGD